MLEGLRGIDVVDYLIAESSSFQIGWIGNGVFPDPLASTVPIVGLKSRSSIKFTFRRFDIFKNYILVVLN